MLVGKSKGGPGQSWTITSWKPAPKSPDLTRAVILTGLFGPVGAAIGL
ncbi:hypothetical protein AB0D83_30975 [Streptomyces decoyicus]